MTAFEKKDLPAPSLKLVLKPKSDTEYVHFRDAKDAPFDPAAARFSAVNAWWLADASLLSYWDPPDATPKFLQPAALHSAPFSAASTGTEGYVAWKESFAIVAFRGTEPDRILDLIADARFKLQPWDRPDERVHIGFKDALDSVWSKTLEVLREKAPGRSVWFTGHSLGGSLATLAADRFDLIPASGRPGPLGGVYTFGSPMVGERRFVDGFNERHRDRSFRFVNDRDTVTRVPPSIFGYRHVNDQRFVGSDDPEVNIFQEGLIDHTPRRYATLVWNAFVGA
jgi:triacylglycerol lipase